MNKSLVSLSITLSLLFSSNVLSEGFNDNYLKFGSGVNGFSPLHSQLRDEIAKNASFLTGNGNNDPDAISNATKEHYAEKVMDIKGSIDIGNNYSLIGSYAREKGNWTDGDDDPSHWIRDWKYRSSELFVGMGKNVDLHPQNFGNILLTYTQLTTSLMYGKNTSKLESVRRFAGNRLWNNISQSKNLANFSLGVRTISNFDIEWAAKYNRVSGKNMKVDHQIEVEATKNIANNFALGAAVTTHRYGDAKMGLFVKASF
tara:strand:+ start:909 stop:1682 length:774 start_codon:yes stop_codon:yes gene_type:complete